MVVYRDKKSKFMLELISEIDWDLKLSRSSLEFLKISISQRLLILILWYIGEIFKEFIVSTLTGRFCVFIHSKQPNGSFTNAMDVMP